MRRGVSIAAIIAGVPVVLSINIDIADGLTY